MNKGEQSSVMKYYNTKHLTEQAYDRSEQERMAGELQTALAQPDSTEVYSIDTLALNDDNFLDQFKIRFDWSFADYTLAKEKTFPSPVEVTAQFFAPHDSTIHEADGIPVEIHTAVVAFDTFDKDQTNANGERQKNGTVLLFKLSANMIGEAQPAPTMKDFAWDKNCATGAVVGEDGVRFFRLTHSEDERVTAEVRRKDSTEESGHTVDAQVVEKKRSLPTIEKIDPASDEALQLKMELETFIASRKGIDQSSEDEATSAQEEPAAETLEANEAHELREKAHSMMTAILGEMQEHATEEAGEITRPSILEDYLLEGTDDPAMSVKIVRDGGNCFVATREQGEPQVGVRREHVGGATNNPNHSDIRTVLQGKTIRETEYVWQGPDAGNYEHTWTLEDNPERFYTELCKMHDIIMADVIEKQAKKASGRLGEARLRKRGYRPIRGK
jgi:hypothetical protein